MLTFRSCHEAEGGNPVTKTAGILIQYRTAYTFYDLNHIEGNTYHDNQNASEYHGYCHHHYNCYSDPLMMKFLARHVQVQPLRADKFIYIYQQQRYKNKSNYTEVLVKVNRRRVTNPQTTTIKVIPIPVRNCIFSITWVFKLQE